jgi:hypothetical protein
MTQSQHCPHCGTEVPRNAKACPECGSDENTGWSENASIGGLNLPDESFDYESYVKEEFGGKKTLSHGLKWHWWAVALGLLSLFLWAGFQWLLH